MTKLNYTPLGASHEPYVGLRMSVPSGVRLNNYLISRDIDRRRGGGFGGTKRAEEDIPQYISGVTDGVTNDEPLEVRFYNKDIRPSDYSDTVPRPSHCDYPAWVRHGSIPKGGGQFSGRMTLPLVFAGAVARQLLAERGILIGGHYLRIGGAVDTPFDPLNIPAETLNRLRDSDFPVISGGSGETMRAEISAAASEGDSVGGCVELAVTGLPIGVGGAFTDGLESLIAPLLFAIPGVKAVEFGAGAALAAMRGSHANDGLCVKNGAVSLMSNNAGGINGGMANGAPVIIRATFRPTPSIALPQHSVDLSTMTDTALAISGRHDCCVALRGIAAAEAAVALAIAEAVL